MSDPVPDKLRKRPRRAEPLQPDNPARGRGTEEAGSTPNPAPAPGTADEQRSTERAREQAESALDNVRKGYG